MLVLSRRSEVFDNQILKLRPKLKIKIAFKKYGFFWKQMSLISNENRVKIKSKNY